MVGAPDPLDDAYQFLAVVIIGVGIIDDGIGALGRQQDVVFLPADIRRCWEKGDLLMQTLLQRLSQMSQLDRIAHTEDHAPSPPSCIRASSCSSCSSCA